MDKDLTQLFIGHSCGHTQLNNFWGKDNLFDRSTSVACLACDKCRETSRLISGKLDRTYTYFTWTETAAFLHEKIGVTSEIIDSSRTVHTTTWKGIDPIMYTVALKKIRAEIRILEGLDPEE